MIISIKVHVKIYSPLSNSRFKHYTTTHGKRISSRLISEWFLYREKNDINLNSNEENSRAARTVLKQTKLDSRILSCVQSVLSAWEKRDIRVQNNVSGTIWHIVASEKFLQCCVFRSWKNHYCKFFTSAQKTCPHFKKST